MKCPTVYVVDRIPPRRSGAVLYFRDLQGAKYHATRTALRNLPEKFRTYSMQVAGPVVWKRSDEWPWAGQYVCTGFQGNEVLTPVG